MLSRAIEAAPAGMAANVLARWAVLPSVAPALRVSNKGILIGTGSLLLIGTLLFISSWLSKKSEQAAAQVNSNESPIGVGERNPIISKDEPPASRRKFDPVTTRTVLKLVDAQTGAAIEGGRLHMAYFYAGGVGERHTGVSNAEGEIAIPFANKEGDPGANLFITAKGYVPKVWSCRGTFPETHEMKLDPALTFAGKVINEEGRPVSNVSVTMDCHAFEMDSRKVEHVAFNSPDTVSVTDGSGTFSLPFVPREIPARQWGAGEVRLNLTADGFQVTQTNFPAPISARHDLELVIRRGVVVMGRVVDPEGRPVANVPVRELHNTGVRVLRTRTNEDGRFALVGVLRPRSEYEKSIVVEPDDWDVPGKEGNDKRPNQCGGFCFGEVAGVSGCCAR